MATTRAVVGTGIRLPPYETTPPTKPGSERAPGQPQVAEGIPRLSGRHAKGPSGTAQPWRSGRRQLRGDGSAQAAAGAFEADFDISAEPALGDSAVWGSRPAFGCRRHTHQALDTGHAHLTEMREGAAEEAYAIYLGQRPEYAASPAFFLDCGDYP